MSSRTAIMLVGTAAALLCIGLCGKAFDSVHGAAVGVKADTIEELPRTNDPIESATPLFSRKHFVIANPRSQRILTYYWFAPEPASPLGSKIPLVVVLHGAPGKAYAAEYLASSQIQRAFPTFVVVPQSPFLKRWAMPEKYSGQEFTASPPTNYTYQPEAESLPDVIQLIDRLMRDFPIDSRRVYIVGCSDGGTGVYGAVLRYPKVFAAGIAISGF